MTAPALAASRAPDWDVAWIVRAALLDSPFPPKAWNLVVVALRLTEGERGVMLRDAFAARLRAADLEASALECMRRRVRPGEALVWAEIDHEGLAHAGFSVVKVGAR